MSTSMHLPFHSFNSNPSGKPSTDKEKKRVALSATLTVNNRLTLVDISLSHCQDGSFRTPRSLTAVTVHPGSISTSTSNSAYSTPPPLPFPPA